MQQGDTPRQIALNTATSWISNAVGMVIGFLMTPFLLSQLSNDLYGLYSLSGSICSWLCFISLPFGTYASRYGTEYLEQNRPGDMNRVFGTAFGLSLAGTFISVIAILVFSFYSGRLFNLSPELQGPARNALLIVGVGSALGLVARVWESTVYVTRRFYLRYGSESLSRILGAVLVVLYFKWFGPSVEFWLAMIAWLPFCFTFFLTIPLAKRGIPLQINVRNFDREEANRALRFCLVVALSSLGGMLFDATDSIVICNMRELGLSQVAPYDIGARWYRLISPLVVAFGTAVSPSLVAHAAREKMDDLHTTLVCTTRYGLLLGLIPVISLGILAKPFIQYWVGSEYLSRSVPVMWIQLGSIIMMVPGMFAYHTLLAVSKLRPFMIASVASGIINLLLSISFVRFFGLGLSGVALGTLVPMTLVTGFYMPFLACKHSGLSWRQYLRNVWFRPLITGLVLFAIAWGITGLWTCHSLIEVLVLLCILGVVFLPILFWVGLTSRERVPIMTRTRKLFNRLYPFKRS